MIPAAFDYVPAASVEQAVGLLREHGDDAKVLAGGQSLLPMMKVRLARPGVLVDIGELRDLSYTRVEGDEIAIGALTRHAELAASPVVRAGAGLLSQAAGLVGDPQVRHRGTIGGSLSHADPAADLPTAVCAWGATLVLHGPDGRRSVPVENFFTGYFDTALAPDELVVEVRVPNRPGAGWGYEKFVRRANDWAIVGAAAVSDSASGDSATGRVALANMGPAPLRAAATEAALAAGASATAAADLAAEGTEPGADLHGDADYRRHLARVLTRRALVAAGVPE